MLGIVADIFWLAGTAGAMGLLAYGVLLVYDFQVGASDAIQRSVARLALYESGRGLEIEEDGSVLRP